MQYVGITGKAKVIGARCRKAERRREKKDDAAAKNQAPTPTPEQLEKLVAAAAERKARCEAKRRIT